MEKLIEQIAKAQTGAKLGAVVIGVALVTALNFFVMGIPYGASIGDIDTRVKRASAEQDRLNREHADKMVIANDLNRFMKEREVLAQRLKEAQAELPPEHNLDELLQSFQDRAQKAGLVIARVEPRPVAKVAGQFYARIPIAMAVEGSFHEIATFFDALGRLRRIVNVSEISIDSPKDANGKMVVSSRFTATTFMLVEPSPAAGTGSAR